MSERRIVRSWRWLRHFLYLDQKERRQARLERRLAERRTGKLLPCGHDEGSWISICSMHFKHKESCGLCNTGRCLECQPEMAAIGEFAKFTNRRDGSPANPFPNLGRRRA